VVSTEARLVDFSIVSIPFNLFQDIVNIPYNEVLNGLDPVALSTESAGRRRVCRLAAELTCQSIS
jgi:hypothetical protein